MVDAPSQKAIDRSLDRLREDIGPDDMKELEERNRDIREKIDKLQEEISKTEVIEGAERTFNDIRYISWVTVGLGLFLVIVPFLAAVTGLGNVTMGIEVFGLSGLGIIDLFALYFYKPMDRLQQATSDFTQHTMIYYSWELTTKLWLRWMDWLNGMSVRTAIEQIQASTVMHVKLYEDLIQAKSLDILSLDEVRKRVQEEMKKTNADSK